MRGVVLDTEFFEGFSDIVVWVEAEDYFGVGGSGFEGGGVGGVEGEECAEEEGIGGEDLGGVSRGLHGKIKELGTWFLELGFGLWDEYWGTGLGGQSLGV